MCGKNNSTTTYRSGMTGSPPRVREKHIFKNLIQPLTGITPACAGKTKSCTKQGKLSQDHPRVCGKNDYRLPENMRQAGSPPRVREKQNGESDTRVIVRITPACAGKTLKNPNEIKTFLSS